MRPANVFCNLPRRLTPTLLPTVEFPMPTKDIGQETVQYISDIFKYYVAYKMTLDQQPTREQAKQAVKTN